MVRISEVQQFQIFLLGNFRAPVAVCPRFRNYWSNGKRHELDKQTKTIDFNNKPIVNGSFPHVCVEHCHNRWRTETKNRIILHVKEISYLQKLLLVLMTNFIINHNSHAHFMLDSRIFYTFSDSVILPTASECASLLKNKTFWTPCWRGKL